MCSRGLIERLESRVLLSVALVKDLHTRPWGGAPDTAVEMNGKVYFAFDDGTSGPRLWSSDGTREDSEIVTNAAVAPANLVKIGGTLYFGTPGGALWKSDGTAQGTVMLAKVADHLSKDSPDDITAVGEMIFFTNGSRALYQFDPVSSVASPVAGIYQSPGWPPFTYDPELTNLNGILYYTAQSTSQWQSGHELWRTDGMPGGTRVVKDIMPGVEGSQPFGLTVVGDKLYFRASSPEGYSELWQTDGTEAGTVRLKDLVPGFPDSPTQLTEFEGALYFDGRTQAQGSELWRTDGTPGGTHVVKDISPGASSSSPGGLKVVGDTLYFFVIVQGQFQLWKSDGTTDGTKMVKAGWSSVGRMTAIGQTLYFTSGPELWKSDGTEGGTHLVWRSTAALPRAFAPLGERLFFAANSFWTTDGTPAGTREVKRFNAGSRPSQLVQLSEGAFVFAADDATSGRSLWRSDGTAEGTIKLSNVVPYGSEWNNAEFARVGDTLFFFKPVPIDLFNSDRELWKTDGTPEGTVRVKDMRLGLGDAKSGLVAAGDRVFFLANDRVNGAGLWTSDGTAEGTYLVKAGASTAGVIGDLVFFRAGDELWKSDGTPAGTILVKDINLSEGTTLDWLMPLRPFAHGGYLYFMGRDDEHGRELWRSDGTAEGTGLVSDLMAGKADSVHYGAGAAGGRLYTVSRDAGGVGLWRYDASGLNPTLVRRLDEAAPWLWVQLREANGILVFAMETEGNGVELWRSDGTEAGTYQIKDINPGVGDGVLGGTTSPHTLTRGPDGAVYFWADDGSSGVSLWKSDGTAAGTVPLPDTYPGLGSAGYLGKGPVPPIFVNGRMYFAASDGEHGVELWQYAKPGDANRDFKVGFEDLVIVAQNYNGTGKTHDQGDFTGDGRTGFADLVVLAQNYSAPPSPPVSAAPSRDAERKSIFSMTPVTRRPPPKRARVQ